MSTVCKLPLAGSTAPYHSRESVSPALHKRPLADAVTDAKATTTYRSSVASGVMLKEVYDLEHEGSGVLTGRVSTPPRRVGDAEPEPSPLAARPPVEPHGLDVRHPFHTRESLLTSEEQTKVNMMIDSARMKDADFPYADTLSRLGGKMDEADHNAIFFSAAVFGMEDLLNLYLSNESLGRWVSAKNLLEVVEFVLSNRKDSTMKLMLESPLFKKRSLAVLFFTRKFGLCADLFTRFPTYLSLSNMAQLMIEAAKNNSVDLLKMTIEYYPEHRLTPGSVLIKGPDSVLIKGVQKAFVEAVKRGAFDVMTFMIRDFVALHSFLTPKCFTEAIIAALKANDPHTPKYLVNLLDATLANSGDERGVSFFLQPRVVSAFSELTPSALSVLAAHPRFSAMETSYSALKELSASRELPLPV